MRRAIAMVFACALASACSRPEVPTTALPKPEGEVTLVGYRGVVREGDAVRYVFDPVYAPAVRMTGRVTASAMRADVNPFLIGLRIEHHGDHHIQRWPKWARRLRGDGTMVVLVEEFQLGHWPTRLHDDPTAKVYAALREAAAGDAGVQAALRPLLAELEDPWARGWTVYAGAEAHLESGTATAAEALLVAELPRVEKAVPGTLPAALYRLRARAASDEKTRAAHLAAARAACPAEDQLEALRIRAVAAESTADALAAADALSALGDFASATEVRMMVATSQLAAGEPDGAKAALRGAPVAYLGERFAGRVRDQLRRIDAATP